MSEYILGIMGGLRVGYQDSSAVLMRGGELISYVEEERIRRDKRSRGRLPESAIRWILDTIDLSVHNIKYVLTHGKSWNIEYAKILMVPPKFKH